MQFMQVVVMSVVAAIVYGIVHDQITVRVCLEYFTVFHPKVVESESPTVLAFVWGVIATWWVGLPLGIVLATAARAGRPPPRDCRSLLRPMAGLLCLMGIAALIAGIAGYFAGTAGWVMPPAWMLSYLASEQNARFVADYWAHNMSYFAGGIGGLGLAIRVALQRLEQQKLVT